MPSQNSKSELERCKTGVQGLDLILRGGLAKNRVYLLQGEPGTGKTTLAIQYLLEGCRGNESCLYVTFSETKEEIEAVAKSHGWNTDGIHMLELSAIEGMLKRDAQNTVFHPSDVEMNQTTDILLAEVEKVKPTRIVFDSVSEMRMLAETPLRYRRQMLSLKQFFNGRNCTVLLLDDLTSTAGDLQVQSIVHGVINLQKLRPDFGDERRRLNIVKMRGIQYSGGHHDYIIARGGLRVFPRLVSAEHGVVESGGMVSSGIKELDSLLGGGMNHGTSNLLLGPAGTGKSSLAMQFAYEAANRGLNAVIFAFEESLETLILRARGLGMDLEKHIKSGKLYMQRIDPAEVSPGEFADKVRTLVKERDIQVLVLDSLNGYMHAMPAESFLILQLHELLSYLGGQGVVSILVLAQSGLMGAMKTPIDLTYLADTVVITRYFETQGEVRKAVSVIKKRSGFHESTIREMTMDKNGIHFGEPLKEFVGVLTGVPVLRTLESSSPPLAPEDD